MGARYLVAVEKSLGGASSDASADVVKKACAVACLCL
jgi:hypothetical protein